MQEYARVSAEDQERVCRLRIDRVALHFSVYTRIKSREAADLVQQDAPLALRPAGIYCSFKLPTHGQPNLRFRDHTAK